MLRKCSNGRKNAAKSAAGIFTGGKMAYYSTCTICGAHLDPGERCTCTERDMCNNKNTDASKDTREKDFGGVPGKAGNCCHMAEGNAPLRP